MKSFNLNTIMAGLALGAAIVVTTMSIDPAPATPAGTAAKVTKRVVYTCPMHPTIVALKPGKCPKCKMALVKKTVNALYTCPMHAKVLALKPGKCPICKMTLIKK
jgi:hypothetical protein